MDITDRVRLVLTNDEPSYISAKAVVAASLRVNGRFQPVIGKPLVDFDQEAGYALKAWLLPPENDTTSSKVTHELYRAVDWGELGKDLHDEIVEEYNDKYPEHNIYMPEDK